VALAETPHLHRLRRLSLFHNQGIGDAGVVALATSPVSAALETLVLFAHSIGRITGVGARALAALRLTKLDLKRHLDDATGDGDARDSNDAADTGKGDANACPSGESLYYTTAGCGTAAVAKCMSDIQDACARTFCGCDGVSFSGGCGTSERPFASAGDCPRVVDGGADGDAHDSKDAADTGTGDANPCASGESLYYTTAGCGTAAVAKCMSDIQDACARTFCGCDGVTFTGGCGTSERPFSSAGDCPGKDDGGGDGASDAKKD
jgi:hypothetical protein